MTEPLWLTMARLCEGVTERVGPGSNPVILAWAKAIDAPGYADDDQAWCAVFANRIALACGLPMAGEGYDRLRARTFAAWGTPLPWPALGAWLVFERPGGAHVGLYVGERDDAYRVLGGNTGDAVAETWIAKSRLIGMRWPAGVPMPDGGPVRLTMGGAVSENEA